MSISEAFKGWVAGFLEDVRDAVRVARLKGPLHSYYQADKG